MLVAEQRREGQAGRQELSGDGGKKREEGARACTHLFIGGCGVQHMLSPQAQSSRGDTARQGEQVLQARNEWDPSTGGGMKLDQQRGSCSVFSWGQNS